MNKKKLILTLLIFIVLIGYAVSLVVRIVQNPTDTFVVEKGDISLEETLEGYILREETIVQGENYKNGIVQIKNEGEKVSKGEAIFRYYSNGEENLLKQIHELNEKIDEALNNQTTIFSKDTKTLEDQITSNLDKIYQVNNLKQIEEYKRMEHQRRGCYAWSGQGDKIESPKFMAAAPAAAAAIRKQEDAEREPEN